MRGGAGACRITAHYSIISDTKRNTCKLVALDFTKKPDGEPVLKFNLKLDWTAKLLHRWAVLLESSPCHVRDDVFSHRAEQQRIVTSCTGALAGGNGWSFTLSDRLVSQAWDYALAGDNIPNERLELYCVFADFAMISDR
jgi:hypothetical protein